MVIVSGAMSYINSCIRVAVFGKVVLIFSELANITLAWKIVQQFQSEIVN